MPEKKLRRALIRLAYEKPQFREHLLPILKEAGYTGFAIGPILHEFHVNGKADYGTGRRWKPAKLKGVALIDWGEVPAEKRGPAAVKGEFLLTPDDQDMSNLEDDVRDFGLMNTRDKKPRPDLTWKDVRLVSYLNLTGVEEDYMGEGKPVEIKYVEEEMYMYDSKGKEVMIACSRFEPAIGLNVTFTSR